tara:strand:+ start:329 stop:463 length:135 start_codon:yes stop_codon:yes gene_type:complete
LRYDVAGAAAGADAGADGVSCCADGGVVGNRSGWVDEHAGKAAR